MLRLQAPDHMVELLANVARVPNFGDATCPVDGMGKAWHGVKNTYQRL